MSKTARQTLLLELLRRGPVRGQDELARALERAGIQATQATISRDLRELGAVKSADGYALAATLAMPKPQRALRLDHVMTSATSGSFVVLRTPPGMAQPTAIEVEDAGLDAVVGTIAGDDTVFVATRDARAAQRLAKTFAQTMAKPSTPPIKRRRKA